LTAAVVGTGMSRTPHLFQLTANSLKRILQENPPAAAEFLGLKVGWDDGLLDDND